MRSLFAFLALFLSSGVSAADLKYATVAGYGGLPLNVAETGNPAGPPILFLHGMAMGLQSFQPQFESDLTKDFRIIAFDLRGHGNSGKPWRKEDAQSSEVWADDVAAVIADKHLVKPVIVGWSFGGFVLADYLRKYGMDGLAGANFVSSFAGLVPQPPPVGNMSPEELKRRAIMQASGDLADNLTIVEETTKIFEFPGITPAYRENIRTLGIMVPAYFRTAMAGRSLDHQDVTPRLTLPVLMTFGSKDIEGMQAPYAAIRKALPKAQYSIYEGVGHLPFAQDSVRFNKELAAFVRSVQK